MRHELIEFALNLLREAEKRSIALSTNNDKQFLFGLSLTSSNADLPVTEDLFSLKRGSQTYSPCHIFTAKGDAIYDPTNESRFKLNKTKELLSRMSSSTEKDKVNRTLITNSMNVRLPILSNFSFVGIHSSVDNYAVFDLNRCISYLYESTKC